MSNFVSHLHSNLINWSGTSIIGMQGMRTSSSLKAPITILLLWGCSLLFYRKRTVAKSGENLAMRVWIAVLAVTYMKIKWVQKFCFITNRVICFHNSINGFVCSWLAMNVRLNNAVKFEYIFISGWKNTLIPQLIVVLIVGLIIEKYFFNPFFLWPTL